jgi:hypothetical protein
MDAYQMEHTADPFAADPFAAARARFEAVLAELGAPAAAGLTHAQLEDLLAQRQQEVTQQLLQDRLDLNAKQAKPAEATGADGFATARAKFEAVVTELGAPAAAGFTHAQLEDLLAERQREVTRQLLQDLLDRNARQETRLPELTGADGVRRRSVEPGHARWLATRFGRVNVTRIAYRDRARDVSNLYPADAALNLPVERHSHGLRRMAAEQAVRGSFDTARDQVNQTTGAGIGKRQVEALTVRAATDVEAFYAAQVPVPATDNTLLVLSTDAKGVVMRPEGLREDTAKAAAAKGANRFATRLAGGEKHGRKRMATLGVVYDANPVVRTPTDVITPPGSTPSPRRKGPAATAKWLTASVADDSAAVVCTVYDQAEARDPTHRRCWVVLVDGANHQLDLIRAQAAQRNVTVHIVIDFIHVLEYLWRAAWSVHTPGDPAAEAWVLGHALSILNGESAAVATAIRAQTAGLGEGRHTGADDCVAYLEAKQECLDYRTALAQGWPIATGVIEGACRHLVQDRLAVTGARWGLAGAEAVLKLRALVSNGDFDKYWSWHLKQEYQRVHRSRYRDAYALAA